MTEDRWTEGLPTEPGDYWFYVLDAPWRSKVKAGRTFLSGNGVLMHVTNGLLSPTEFGKRPTKRVWHQPLDLPSPPAFDRTCPPCSGDGKDHGRPCYFCRGKGQLT